jgi:hypothetical protein
VTSERLRPAQVIDRVLPPDVRRDRPYTGDLPADLAPWHVYTVDGGHSILVVLSSTIPFLEPGESLESTMVPAPVRLVLRSGCSMREGVQWADLPYDDELGLLAEEGDDEY